MKDRMKGFGLELKWWLKKYYPPFVYSHSPARPEGVPVFIFHSVEPSSFKEKLEFLSRNGYAALSADEFYEYIRSRYAPPGKSVLLTFDDGDRSLYEAAYPLLRAFGMRAACFVSPGLIGSAGFVSWDEMSEMQKSGAVDFQSHTLDHERIFTGERIKGFLDPSAFHEKLGLGMPSVRKPGGYERLSLPGAPMYETGSRMGTKPRFHDDESLREACAEHVREAGGEKFFRRGGWKRELFAFAREASAGKIRGEYESEARRSEEIFRSLARSKEMLEEKLGKSVRHLAYPWGEGSAEAVRLSKEAGYRTNFWGPLAAARIGKPGIDPMYIPRLKDDYIFRLPGKGRKAVFEVFGYKLARRAASRDIY